MAAKSGEIWNENLPRQMYVFLLIIISVSLFLIASRHTVGVFHALAIFNLVAANVWISSGWFE